jgi:hypothetical protein
MERLSYPWWIVGRTKEVLAVMPEYVDGNGLGCIYALGLKSGAHKIGSTRHPVPRIKSWMGTFDNYARDPVVTIGLSVPTSDYSAIEKAMHAYFRCNKIGGELFDVPWKKIRDVAVAEFGGARLRPLPFIPEGIERRRSGSRPKPWLRSDRGTWFITIDGKQCNLGPDCVKAYHEFKRLMDDRAIPTDVTLEELEPQAFRQNDSSPS